MQKEMENQKRTVTKIENLDKHRRKIWVNQEEVLVLYKGEVEQFQLSEDVEIGESDYQIIIQEILPKRAKKRCLYLLQRRPYTEQNLRDKLKEGFYPEGIIEEAIAYVKSFHYLDDYEYACQYIFYRKEKESRKKMEDKLIAKGISFEILERAFEASYQSEDEQIAIEYQQAQKLLEKKQYQADKADWQEKQKVYAFLVRKGIASQVIRKAMDL